MDNAKGINSLMKDSKNIEPYCLFTGAEGLPQLLQNRAQARVPPLRSYFFKKAFPSSTKFSQFIILCCVSHEKKFDDGFLVTQMTKKLFFCVEQMRYLIIIRQYPRQNS